MTKEIKKTMKSLFIYFLLFVCLFASFFCIPIEKANAEEKLYTNVLEDLQKDETFNKEDYLVNIKDYSLQVIQIAESSDKELFVYVYQPYSPNEALKATTIRISTSVEEISPYDYHLTLLNSEGTLYKYKVENFNIEEKDVRCYEIVAIHRLWNEKYDKDLPKYLDNKITEVVFKVAQKWTATTENEKISYTKLGIEVIEITDKFVGFCRYEGGFEPFGWAEACDSHFVSFNTDRRIDKLLEARVEFTSQKYFTYVVMDPFNYQTLYGEKEEKVVDLKYDQKGEFTGSGWFAIPYSWKRISKVNEFIDENKNEKVFECGVFDVSVETGITDVGLKALKGKQWVLRFAETKYDVEGTVNYNSTQKTIVGDVSILKLTFETNNEIYRLGVVDNKQTGSDEPINYTKVSIKLKWWMWLLIAVGIIILILIFAPTILSWIIKILFKILEWTIKFLWWIISAPFTIFRK